MNISLENYITILHSCLSKNLNSIKMAMKICISLIDNKIKEYNKLIEDILKI